MKYMAICILFFTQLFSTALFANTYRVSPQDLHKQINDKQLLIVDVRSKNEFDEGHIKNAVNFPAIFSYLDINANGKIQQPRKMQKYLRERGISHKLNLVIYDGGTLVEAARIFWVLEVYGFKKIKILDRGYKYWVEKKLPTSTEQPKIKPSKYISIINHKRLSSKFSTQVAMHKKNTLIIDARSSPAYKGEISVAKRFGHIPSALNIPFINNLVMDSNFLTLKNIDELKQVYKHIPKTKKIIIYCKIGKVSSMNYFALRELGYDVSNYDASWREWGNDDSLPIEK